MRPLLERDREKEGKKVEGGKWKVESGGMFA